MTVRAGIVVTGNEVLNGRVQDSNGPWISERLAELGVEVASIIVGERCREDYRDVDQLAASIARYGLLHPIVVDAQPGHLGAVARRPHRRDR